MLRPQRRRSRRSSPAAPDAVAQPPAGPALEMSPISPASAGRRRTATVGSPSELLRSRAAGCYASRVAGRTARGRPTTAIKDDNDYKRIFSSDKAQHPLEMYGVLARLLDSVEGFFRKNASGIDQVYRNNLQFHVLMVVSWALNEHSTLPAPRITKLDLSMLTEPQLNAAVQWVRLEFDAAGAEDRTAKNRAFTQRLKTNWFVAATIPVAATTPTAPVPTDAIT
jgi:hypothetical protein